MSDDCCNGDIPAEEPLADWERELLAPDPNQVIHIYPAEGMTACDIKLDDGKTHAVNSNIQVVSCGDCKVNYLNYVNVEQHRKIEELKEKLRVSQQAYTAQHREVVNLRRRREVDARTMHRMREDIDHLRDDGLYETAIARDGSYYPVRRPVPRFPY